MYLFGIIYQNNTEAINPNMKTIKVVLPYQIPIEYYIAMLMYYRQLL